MTAAAVPSVDWRQYVEEALASSDPAELETRASALEAAGFGKTAAEIRRRASRLGAQSTAGAVLASPFPELADDADWQRYVRLMVQTRPYDAVGPAGQLGAFLLPVKRLEDLGLVTSSARNAGLWQATAWRTPLTREVFLGDPLIQHRTFRASCRRYAPEIALAHGPAMGAELEGLEATLSGLLAVAHHAGPNLRSWIASPDDRMKWKESTTAAYKRTTGVF